jgi:rod shape-determining protein MreC
MQIPNSESSGARPILLVALVALALIVTTVYFREGEDGPFHDTRRVVMAAASPFERVGEFVTRPLRAVGGWVGDLGTSRKDLGLLRKQNAELRARNAELEEARQENTRIRALVKLVETQKLTRVAARVISRPTSAWEGIIVIDKGTRDGAARGMPVIGNGGLIGQIVEASGSSARVRLISDQRSGVAALVQRTRAEGIVKGSINRDITLDFVANPHAVRAGDAVITSGMGGVYPKGILIGEVTIVKQEAGLSPLVSVRPVVKLAQIEEVLVLTGRAPQPVTGGGE